MKRVLLGLCVGSFMVLSGWGVEVPADSFVTRLHDVEVVGVKHLPGTAVLEPTTTVSQAQIERLNIATVRGVSELTPNFYMPQYGSRMTSSIYVRGLGARIDQPVVGLTVDNVPILNKDNYDFDLFDIERMEVVRGSCAVLNGRNAMGGQINIRTLSPWAYRGVRAMAEYGRHNEARVAAGWYGLLSRQLATAVTAQFGTDDGCWRNAHNGQRVGTDRHGSARWKLSWHPGQSSRWSLSNTAALTVGKQNGYPYESVESGLIAYNDSTYYRRTSLTDALSVSYTGRRMIATSVTSVQYINDDMTLDQDFLPEDYFTITQRRKEWAVTQDLFAKGMRQNYSWLIGVFGFYKGTDMHAPVNIKDTGIRHLIEDNVNRRLPAGMELRWDERNLLLASDFDITDWGLALYHQSTWTWRRLTLQGGLRWDIERVGLDYTSQANTSCTMGRLLPNGKWMPLKQQPLNIDDHGNLHQTFNQLLPQVTVAVDLGRGAGVRASVTKGYKAGGYNTQMFSDVAQQQLMQSVGLPVTYDPEKMMTYKPEKSWTYELSADYATADRRFAAEAVLFNQTVRDQQLTVFPDGNTTGRAMTNAGRTRSMGAELSATWHVTPALQFRAAYGYTNAKFTRYDNGKEDLQGKRLPYAPAQTLFAEAVYTFRPIGTVTPSLAVNTRGAGNIYWDDANTLKQPFYATLGASLTLSHAHGSLMLWGRNLTDTGYQTFYFESIGNRFIQRGQPWSIGATLRVNI